jgi:glycosyltransferase involved in cell wall biosynthesis
MRLRRFKHLKLPEDRGPLKVMFVHTEVVVGGAETLLVEIIRGLDRDRFTPELCCLKRLSTLGEVLAREVPTTVGLLRNKYDVGVLGRLTGLLRRRKVDAVVTVGTGGDRMFWGRLAAWRAGVPVILSSLHSTGYPVKVEPLNRLLAPLSDGFIGCARMHSEYLVSNEGCPRRKVFTIYNGVDVARFRPADRNAARRRLDLAPDRPVAGIVAALRPEKQHGLLLEAMRIVVQRFPDCLLLVVGDGVERRAIETKIKQLDLTRHVRLLGTRHDVADLLPAMDVKVLSSKMEANPASTLEASACGLPVVAPAVGSLPETVLEGVTGFLFPADDPRALADALCRVFADPDRAGALGRAGRELVCRRFSLLAMVGGYQRLIDGIYRGACRRDRFTPEQFDETCAAELQTPVLTATS